MDPVSNVDRLVLLLRQRLLERSKASASSRRDEGGASERAPAGVNLVQALAAVRDLDDRQLKRALIQNILVEQLGESLLNEARFQQVVDRVTDTLEQDDSGARLLARVADDLRVAAR